MQPRFKWHARGRNGGTHFSLLLACMLPLCLTPPALLSSSHSPVQACHVAPFAGLLSVGIGDTIASVVGVQWGQHPVAVDSPKSWEGTAAAAAAMLAASLLLTALLPPPLAAGHAAAAAQPSMFAYLLQAPVTACGVACLFSALLEAFTQQLDNAFIPLLHFSLCCL
ncbi:hypothetical protein CLOM_g9576 [Closterium sp. NIES-68]|nr:hypothetical protein CLOM_g21026 [Closterium sp. NIES-68]GJP50438.1 hypothetical protein CLOM_g9576 [Closterium sp. NIES-68]GJP74525.1 hypothetical protein CLOP_g5089 [Closterium sp. NIES-67]